MPTVEGKITKVELDETTGWYGISTDNADVRKLSTKIAAKANEAAELRRTGAVVVIEYSSKPKTLADGRTFQNFYYESAVAQSGPSSSTDGIERVSPPSRKTDPSDAWRICLGAGAKLAVATLPLMPEEHRDFETQRRIAVAWARWIYTTPFEPGPSVEQVEALDVEQPPPYGDADIPF